MQLSAVRNKQKHGRIAGNNAKKGEICKPPLFLEASLPFHSSITQMNTRKLMELT